MKEDLEEINHEVEKKGPDHHPYHSGYKNTYHEKQINYVKRKDKNNLNKKTKEDVCFIFRISICWSYFTYD